MISLAASPALREPAIFILLGAGYHIEVIQRNPETSVLENITLMSVGAYTKYRDHIFAGGGYDFSLEVVFIAAAGPLNT